MKLLIDTHIYYWLIKDQNRIGEKTTSLIYDWSNQVYLSYFSVMEIAMKTALGKMRFDFEVVKNVQAAGASLMMPDLDTIHNYRIFNEINKDPYDNFLISTAISHGLTLVTMDQRILATKAKNFRVLDARK